MLIKSMSRKTPSFAQLYDYITRHTENTDLLITHNMPEDTTDRSVRLKTFFDNERYMKLRKAGVRVFHEVLSFHADDAPALTREMLQKLTEYYLQLRAPHALAIAEAHFDTANPHVHIMISANELNSNKRVRVSKRDFQDIKIAVEHLQQELYPQLTKSVCQKPKHSFWQRSKDFKLRLGATLSVNNAEFQMLVQRFSLKTSTRKMFDLRKARTFLKCRKALVKSMIRNSRKIIGRLNR